MTSRVRDGSSPSRALIALVMTALLCVGLLSTASEAAGATPGARSDTALYQAADERAVPVAEASLFAMPVRCFEPDGDPRLGACRLLPRRPGAPTLVVWGDSHAREMLTGIIKAIGHRRVNLVAYIAGGCPPVDPGHGPDAPAVIAAGCEKHNALAVRDLTRMSRHHRRVQVVVAAGWELYRNAIDGQFGRWQTYGNSYISQTARLVPRGLPRLFRTMRRLDLTTHVVGQAPMIPNNPPACAGAFNEIDFTHATPRDFAYPCALPRTTVMVAAKPLRRALRANLRLLRPARRGHLVMPAQVLCRSGTCPGVVDRAEVWHDPVHISNRSSARLAPLFRPVVRAVVAR
ncbi:SGNH hydrolase domain-containing protein [Nocardioides sp. C4-1]|uniref:SGNH hydrolase domain-containing protein n=1 Tax=Nocardioides sp. C4-1 TaxID=3151851 RepID=UPI0032631107